MDLGRKLGEQLKGGDVVELVSDLGGGKTVLVRGLAEGIGSSDQVMSPTFTISRIYTGDDIELHHFDFYRLEEPGIMSAELTESIDNIHAAVAIEWSDAVEDILPSDRLQIRLTPLSEKERRITLRALGDNSARLAEVSAQ